jgi:hypothetical protein
MKKSPIVCLALLIASGLATPALAATSHLASIPVTNRTDHTMTFANFKAPVDVLQLSADNDIRCVSVTVTFASGRTQKVFSGNLPANGTKEISFDGDRRNLSEVGFECRAVNNTEGHIGISTTSD